jgi:hypothetical protein
MTESRNTFAPYIDERFDASSTFCGVLFIDAFSASNLKVDIVTGF